jgi:hypothetical protein
VRLTTLAVLSPCLKEAWQWNAPPVPILVVILMWRYLQKSRTFLYLVVIPHCAHAVVSVNVSWKSTLFVALDACFKLKLKDRSSVDPDLGTGFAYMVSNKNYLSHIAHCERNPLPKEVSLLYSGGHQLITIASDPRVWINAACRQRSPHKVISWLRHHWSCHLVILTCTHSACRCCRPSKGGTVREH